jgi:hypothetical protein
MTDNIQIAAFKRMAIPSKGRHHVSALTELQDVGSNHFSAVKSAETAQKAVFVYPYS